MTDLPKLSATNFVNFIRLENAAKIVNLSQDYLLSSLDASGFVIGLIQSGPGCAKMSHESGTSFAVNYATCEFHFHFDVIYELFHLFVQYLCNFLVC